MEALLDPSGKRKMHDVERQGESSGTACRGKKRIQHDVKLRCQLLTSHIFIQHTAAVAAISIFSGNGTELAVNDRSGLS